MARLHARAFTDQRPWTEAEFSAFCASPLCIRVGDAHGFALARVVADEAELLTIAVDPGAQGRGRGRELMAAWHALALDRGARSAFLEVAAGNSPALKLYARCGYARTGLRKGYYPGGVDALLMARSLT